MKTIGIIGAMDEEIALLKSKLEIISAKNIVGVDFYMGKMSGKNVIIVRSGIGKVNAAICTQILIDLYAVDYIVNVGVAGAIAKELELGDVVISSDLVYHDFKAFPNEKVEPWKIPRMPQSNFIADEALIDLAKNAANKILENNKVYIGRIVSGDEFVSSKERKSELSVTFKASCAEMEGAAIAHTCFLNKLPFVVIRSISDLADDAALDTYTGFLETAVKNSSNIVENIIENI